MDLSPSLTRQLQSEIEHLRKDLESKDDLLVVTKRDNDRLRALLRESREEFRVQIEQLAAEKASWESKVMEARLEAEKERGNKKDVQRELDEALTERERQLRSTAELRKQIDGKLNKLVQELQAREEEVHNLQHQLELATREKDRLRNFEKLFHTREEQLTATLAQLSALQQDNARITAKESSLMQELEAFRLLREKDITRETEVKQHPSPLPVAPPPLTGLGGAHVVESGHLLPSQISFAKDVSKDLAAFSEVSETLFDELSDLKVILVRGAAASAELIGSNSLDRKRLAAYRKAQLGLPKADVSNTAEELKSLMSYSKDSQSRLAATLGQVTDFVKELRTLVERNCTMIGGIEAMSQKLAGPTRPQPWPAPSSEDSIPQRTTPPSQGHASVSRDASATPGLVAQLQEALAKAEQAASSHRLTAHELQLKVDSKESDIRRLEGSVSSLTAEVQFLRNQERNRENEMKELEREFREKSQQQREREDQLRQELLAAQRDSDNKLRSLQREADDNQKATEHKYVDEIRALKNKHDDVQREKTELTEHVHKLSLELERAKERTSSHKAQRERLEAELKKVKGDLVSIATEARHLQESLDEATKELECYKSVERFEQEQQDNALLMNVDDGIWSEWKASRKPQREDTGKAVAPTFVRPAASRTPVAYRAGRK